MSQLSVSPKAVLHRSGELARQGSQKALNAGRRASVNTVLGVKRARSASLRQVGKVRKEIFPSSFEKIEVTPYDAMLRKLSTTDRLIHSLEVKEKVKKLATPHGIKCLSEPTPLSRPAPSTPSQLGHGERERKFTKPAP